MACLAVFPGTAFCQVHMCKGADGRKVFSDVPCGPDSSVVDVRPAAGGASVYPDATMRGDFYDIRGTTLDALRREIAGKGPEGWWGMATTRMTYRITTRQTAAGCAIATVRASADSRVRLPRWVNRAEATAPVQDQWDVIIRTLDLHERGHVQIHLDGAKELERSILDMSEETSCDLIQAEAKRRHDAVANRVRDRQVTYDRETDHGRIQWSPYR